MKNLKPYSDDDFAFHQKVLKSKKNIEGYKDRVKAMDDSIRSLYEEYDAKYSRNTLEDQVKVQYSTLEKNDLKKLYKYDSKPIQELRLELTTSDFGRIVDCQCCGLNKVNTFDHFLPQSDFPEFVVKPLNLIPSCQYCNGKKSTNWRKNGRRSSLNLYLDEIPDVQFLFVDITVSSDDDSIKVKFRLEQTEGVDDELFQLLTDHYNDLELFDRFSENCDNLVSELDNQIKSNLKRLDISQVQEMIYEECEDNSVNLGRNHWKLVLKKALVESDEYMSRFVE